MAREAMRKDYHTRTRALHSAVIAPAFPAVATQAHCPGAPGSGEQPMSYTIGFQAKNQRAIFATEAATAGQAVAIVAALRAAADEIKFIRSPQEGDMGIEMLLLLAKEEAEEMPQRA